jgi:hypothetical protein
MATPSFRSGSASDNNDTGTAIQSAYPQANTAGNILVAFVRIAGSSDILTGVSDNVNGSWTFVDKLQVGSSHWDYIYRYSNCAANTPTVTTSTSGSTNHRVVIDEIQGAHINGFGPVAKNTGTSTSASSGNLATTIGNALVVALVSTDTAEAVAYTNSFSDRHSAGSRLYTGSRGFTTTQASVAATATLDSSQLWGCMAWAVYDAEPVSGYTITADQGSFTYTGQAANLVYGKFISAEQGSLTLAGQAANLLKGFVLSAEQGSYSLIGSAALIDIEMDVDQGSYTLNGQAANLLKGFRITADQGSYTLTGQDANLVEGEAGAYSVTAEAGTYTLTGVDVGLTATRLVTADQGSYTLAGQAATLLKGFRLAADYGAYTLTGIDADLIPDVVNYTLSADMGTFSLSGQNATLTFSGASTENTIDGSASYVINEAYGSITLYHRGDKRFFTLVLQ